MGKPILVSCSEVRKHLPDYLNRAIDVETAQQMRRHFDQCTNCRIIVRSAVETFREFFDERRAEKPAAKAHAA